jgi:hypothetical protein
VSRNGEWWIVCALMPLVIAGVRAIWEKLHAAGTQGGNRGCDVSQAELCQLENKMLSHILVLMTFTISAGVVFFHVASVCDLDPEKRPFIGKWIVTPLMTMVLCVAVTYGLFIIWRGEPRDQHTEDGVVVRICREAFCWCRSPCHRGERVLAREPDFAPPGDRPEGPFFDADDLPAITQDDS